MYVYIRFIKNKTSVDTIDRQLLEYMNKKLNTRLYAIHTRYM